MGRVRRCEVVHGTRRQADARLAEIQSTLGATYGGTPTVGRVWEAMYWPDASEDLRPNTRSKYLGAWDRHVAPRWGDVPCAQVAPPDVQRWLSSMSGPTAEVCRVVLSRVMARAVFEGLVHSNPVQAVERMPSGTEAPKDARVWDSAQVDRAWAAMRGSWLEGPFLLAARGGLRYGEALGVTGADVSAHGGVCRVEVRRAVDKSGGVVGLKTAGSRRVAVIGGPWGGRLLEIASAAGDGWLTADPSGLPVGQYAARREWRGRLEAAGIDPIPFANLRNSYATIAQWEWGIPLEQVARLMGHATAKTTYRHYDRPGSDDLERAVADAVAGVLQSS